MLINSLIAINLGFDLPFARLSVGYLFFEMWFGDPSVDLVLGDKGIDRSSLSIKHPIAVACL